MKKKLMLFACLAMLFWVTSCGPDCPVCVTPTPGADVESLQVEIDRDNLPDNLLEEVVSATRPDEFGAVQNADPYLEYEIILIGPSGQLDDLLDLPQFDLFEIEDGDGSDFRLVKTGGLPVEEAMSLINVAKINNEGLSEIDAGKNYLTAAPWDVEASPWDVEASGEGFGDNFTLKYTSLITGSNGEIYHDIPWKQWAFQNGASEGIQPWGVNLFNGGEPMTSTLEVDGDTLNIEKGVRTVEEDGSGISVIIYDTSPFSSTLKPEMVLPEEFAGKLHVRVADSVLLDVEGAASEKYTGTVEHGLFVAGLVHIVAPGANIELVKILNNQGVGELYTLTNELKNLLEDDKGNPLPDADLSNIVINLSLGFHPEAQNVAVDGNFYGDPAIREFKQILSEVHHAGAVIVAAAGNHSSFYYSDNTAPEIMARGEGNISLQGDIGIMNLAFPARWPETIGVSGEALRVPSCFSNQPLDGNEITHTVYAPSGGGRQDEEGGTNDGGKTIVPVCGSPKIECNNTPPIDETTRDYNCPYAIVSTTTSGYRQWSGTSFAAPIVSGIVALVRQKCDDSESSSMSSGDINDYIYEKFVERTDHPRLSVDVVVGNACN